MGNCYFVKNSLPPSSKEYIGSRLNEELFAEPIFVIKTHHAEKQKVFVNVLAHAKIPFNSSGRGPPLVFPGVVHRVVDSTFTEATAIDVYISPWVLKDFAISSKWGNFAGISSSLDPKARVTDSGRRALGYVIITCINSMKLFRELLTQTFTLPSKIGRYKGPNGFCGIIPFRLRDIEDFLVGGFTLKSKAHLLRFHFEGAGEDRRNVLLREFDMISHEELIRQPKTEKLKEFHSKKAQKSSFVAKRANVGECDQHMQQRSTGATTTTDDESSDSKLCDKKSHHDIFRIRRLSKLNLLRNRATSRKSISGAAISSGEETNSIGGKYSNKDPKIDMSISAWTATQFQDKDQGI